MQNALSENQTPKKSQFLEEIRLAESSNGADFQAKGLKYESAKFSNLSRGSHPWNLFQ